MQTLNVGAGRSDQEYKAAEEQRLTDLRSDVQGYAFYFFVAAGLAALGSGLLLFKLNIIVNIGAIDLFPWYARDLIQSNPLLFYRAAAATWVVVLVLLGLAARKNQRWAFWAGVVLYGADLIPLIVAFTLWTAFAVGIHAFFVLQWFKGQQALGELNEAPVLLQKEASSGEDLSRSAAGNQR
jgi:hypothetical protein